MKDIKLARAAIEIVEALLAQYEEEGRALESNPEANKRMKELVKISQSRARFALKELEHIVVLCQKKQKLS